ncbi:MAG: hypothetical protein IKV72_02710 [Firmicutes bacterium]|nr:hypothetical protein [Bacillota bacterium]
MGPAPELTYFYDPVAAAFQHDTSVKVSITAIKNLDNQVPEDQDITHGVIFYRDECDFTSCDHRDRTKVNPTTNRINFVVHINTFELKIHKTGADLDLDPDSSFLFRISGPNGFSMDAVIHGNGYAVIENLPVAEYTITEITDWSWRYEPEANDQKILATDVKDGIASITFNNVRKQKQWLDGEHFSENRFYHGTQPEGGEVR